MTEDMAQAQGRRHRRTGPLYSALRGAGLVLAGFILGSLSTPSMKPAPQGAAPPSASGAAAAAAAPVASWTCAMHPQVRQAQPGVCPLCGMRLIPVTAQASSHPRRVSLSKRARALARLRTTPVRRQQHAASELRLLGRAVPDETTLKTITAWTAGRIDRLHVGVTGQRVRKGQVIATLYSPEIFAAQQDFIVAKRQLRRMADSPKAARQVARAVEEAAREKLLLLGVPEGELLRMEEKGRPTRTIPIRTPFGGTVIERLATEGAYVSTGTPLYRIANLRKLWVQLDAYESDLPRVRIGQDVRLYVKALPGKVFHGKVTFIQPVLHPKRRTAQLRVEVDNRDAQLRPGMFAEAKLRAEVPPEKDGQGPLVIPATAPLFTGRRALVYLQLQDGSYEARTVRLGPRLGAVYPVVAGLQAGDVVVTRGAFVLDADLQIRGGTSMMAQEDAYDGEEAEAGEGEALRLSQAQFSRILSAYLALQEALAKDRLSQATAAAERLVAAAPAEGTWAPGLKRPARHLLVATNLEAARLSFEDLTARIEFLLRRLGNPLRQPLHRTFCPMAAGSRGAFWVQRGTAIQNPYFGTSMQSCGTVQEAVPPGGRLQAQGEGQPARGGH